MRIIVYVSCSKGDCIEVIALDPATGVLSPIESVALPGNGMPLAVAPDKQCLYAAVAGGGDGTEPQFAAYTIDEATGKLELQEIVEAPGRMSHITVDRSGRYLLGASVSNDLFSSSRIKIDGTIDAAATKVYPVPSKAHQITTDQTNQFAFVPNLGADLVLQLKFDPEAGTFAANEPSQIDLPKGAAPRHLAHHPGGCFAYLLNEEQGTITVFELDVSAGRLSEIQTQSFLPEGFDAKPWGAQVLVTPDGRYLYASDRTSSTISLHAIDPETGCITKVSSTPTETCPRNFTIDPSGRYLISAGEKSDRVACYAIDAKSGRLDLTSTVNTGTGPLWVEAMHLG